jgi:hypothetical protein
MLITFL